jgi:hypothetical protein
MFVPFSERDKFQEYTVVFNNHTFQKVEARNRKEAVVLAQNEQIRKRETYNVVFVKDAVGNVVR